MLSTFGIENTKYCQATIYVPTYMGKFTFRDQNPFKYLLHILRGVIYKNKQTQLPVESENCYEYFYLQ